MVQSIGPTYIKADNGTYYNANSIVKIQKNGENTSKIYFPSCGSIIGDANRETLTVKMPADELVNKLSGKGSVIDLQA